MSRSLSSAWKKDVNSPLGPALYTGAAAMTPSAAPSASTACCSFGVTSWLVSAVVMSAASSRRSITRVRVATPRCPARATARCAARSASSLVEDGSDVPALTTTRLNVSLIVFPYLPIPNGSWLREPGAELFELAELKRAEPGAHRLRDRAAVPPADPPLDGQAGRGKTEADAAAVPGVGRAADEFPLHQPVNQPGQGRLAEQDVPVEFAEADRFRALGQRVEDVVLLHGEVLPGVFGGEPPHQRRMGEQK